MFVSNCEKFSSIGEYEREYASYLKRERRHWDSASSWYVKLNKQQQQQQQQQQQLLLFIGDGVFSIESIKEGSLVGRDGRLHSGDILLKVNGVTLSGLTKDKVTQLLNSNREYIQIVLADKEVNSETNSVIEVAVVSPDKPPIPNTDVFTRESSSRSLEYPTWSRLSQRSHTSDNSGIGSRNSPMRSSFQVICLLFVCLFVYDLSCR